MVKWVVMGWRVKWALTKKYGYESASIGSARTESKSKPLLRATSSNVFADASGTEANSSALVDLSKGPKTQFKHYGSPQRNSSMKSELSESTIDMFDA